MKKAIGILSGTLSFLSIPITIFGCFVWHDPWMVAFAAYIIWAAVVFLWAWYLIKE